MLNVVSELLVCVINRRVHRRRSDAADGQLSLRSFYIRSVLCRVVTFSDLAFALSLRLSMFSWHLFATQSRRVTLDRNVSGRIVRVVDVDRIRHYFPISIQILSTFSFSDVARWGARGAIQWTVDAASWYSGRRITGHSLSALSGSCRLAFCPDSVDRLNEIHLGGDRDATCIFSFSCCGCCWRYAIVSARRRRERQGHQQQQFSTTKNILPTSLSNRPIVPTLPPPADPHSHVTDTNTRKESVWLNCVNCMAVLQLRTQFI